MSISKTGYGVDVAARRADDLDKRLLALVREQSGATVLDLGCGAGGGVTRLEAAGAQVVGVDQHDFSADFTSLTKAKFMQADILDYVPDQTFDFVVCQRTIHYLSYENARLVLQNLRPFCQRNIFLSISGVVSDLGRFYRASDTTIAERFSPLTSSGQATFGIDVPICLYTEAEARELLVETGWEIIELWASAFGNVKIIARPRVT